MYKFGLLGGGRSKKKLESVEDAIKFEQMRGANGSCRRNIVVCLRYPTIPRYTEGCQSFPVRMNSQIEYYRWVIDQV